MRIEKMVLKDELLHIGVASDVSSVALRPYVIPLDHCAVSPLFWGEQHPSCQCVPSTPGKRRGVVSLVYPIKTFEQQFKDYLTHMSNSSHRGIQLAVFVPTSYSGRHRPVTVGKSIVALDELKPSCPISGWFTIMSDETTTDDAVQNEGEKGVPGALVEVGKLKITFTVAFFTRAPPSPPRPAARAASAMSRGKSVEVEERTQLLLQEGGRCHETESSTAQAPPSSLHEASVAAAVQLSPKPKLQQAQQQQRIERGETTERVRFAPQAQAHEALTAVIESSKSALPTTPLNLETELNRRDTIGQLLQRGYRLREKMAKATSTHGGIEAISSPVNLISTRPTPSVLQNTGYIPPPSGAEHLHGSLPIPRDTLESSASSGSDASMESSVEDEDDDDNGGGIGVARHDKDQKSWSDVKTGKRPFRLPFRTGGTTLSEDAYVEVDISRIAFASGRSTLGMEEMRIGIRLSKDVKTDEPVDSYSSYVHRVPLVRGADHHIVIGFPVRAFSADKSRMVISFYRVRSAPVANPPGELLLPVPPSAQRVLVEETLLGMCIVGLYSQMRDIVFHDPITGEDPAQAHLRVCVRGNHADTTEHGRVNGALGEETLARQSISTVPGVKGGKMALTLDNRRVRSSGAVEGAANGIEVKRESSHGRKRDVQSRSSSSSSSSSTTSTAHSSSSSPRNRAAERVRASGGGGSPNLGNVSGAPPLPSFSAAARHPTVTAVMSAAAAHNNNNNIDAATADDDDRYKDGYPVEYVTRTGAATTLPQHVERQLATAPSDRFRMHVSIRSGKDLPMVTLTRSGSPLVSVVAAVDQLKNGVRSAVTSDGRLVLVDSEHRIFQPPTTFFVIEDVYSGAESRAASRGAVPDWYVEAAVRGEYDRTLVVPHSRNPQYEYECVLSLPREAVCLRQAVDGERAVPRARNSQLAPDSDLSKASRPSMYLQEMRLTLWHALNDVDPVASTEPVNDEKEFWARTAMLGDCRVDLRSLRFLKVLDGWYRVNSAEKVDEVVGYVRVSVRLL
ncbi:hypothetical protein DQ04_05291010 [Trypanosoma grayi]|uniref:hypothetical protein n=1 Tax=Trypanosoma grayi TaxID=71804 RepID=UPI0004F4B76F|nr:hypothetical protein DQ04_05291010 [Trypanosoma grayi]KEG09394.1 hypothetical protein DQ04_05291010 [Trypanosoma grayi]